MKRLLFFLAFCAIQLLAAMPTQDVSAQFEQSARSMVMTFSDRTDYSHMFVTPYPYTLMMFHQAHEMQYTSMNQYTWDAEANDWHLYSELTIDYDGEYPTVFTQSLIYQETEFLMVYTYTLNAGIPTQLLVSANLSGQMMDTTRETYTYDEHYLIHILGEVNAVTNWQEDYQMEYTWTSEDITSAMQTSWNGDQWENDKWETWEYNGSTPSLYTYRYWDGDQYVNEEQETFTFSGILLLEELGKVWDGSAWINDYYSTFEWDGNNIESNLDMDWTGTEWINDHKATYYMVDGSLGYVVSQMWVNNDWVNSGKYVYGFGDAVDGEDVPQVASSIDVYPNPFNPSTNISYSMASDGFVKIDIYNIRGQKIQTLFSGHKDAGTYTLTWNAQVAGGIYFALMNTGTERIVKKMVLLK